MSCVLMIVVMLYSSVISWIRLSITTDVIGSSPEFGSSQNRYFGFSTMARAIATRLIIPAAQLGRVQVVHVAAG